MIQSGALPPNPRLRNFLKNIYIGVPPQTPLKKLFREKFLKNLQKLLKKQIILCDYLSLRHGHTRTVGIFQIYSASELLASPKVKHGCGTRTTCYRIRLLAKASHCSRTRNYRIFIRINSLCIVHCTLFLSASERLHSLPQRGRCRSRGASPLRLLATVAIDG